MNISLVFGYAYIDQEKNLMFDIEVPDNLQFCTICAGCLFLSQKALPSRTMDSVGYGVASCEPHNHSEDFHSLQQIRVTLTYPDSKIRETEHISG